MTLGMSVTVPGLPTDVWPACFPDINGQVFLRGHVTLSPVPAVGGAVLALFPQDANGVCACTPKPDPGTEDNTVIATTTALSYPTTDLNAAEVCIVRLLISQYLPPDVNRDFMVNQTDLMLIQTSLYWDLDPTEESNCPLIGIRRVCGPADVNQDGKVNQLDYNSVQLSLANGTNVTCGGVYVTAFSCGSTKTAPLTPAVDISLDSIVFFSDDGLIGTVNPLQNQRRSVTRQESLMTNMLNEIEALQGRVGKIEGTYSENIVELDRRVDSKIGLVEQRVDNKVGRLDMMLGHQSNKLGEVEKKVNVSGSEILAEVLVSVGVVLLTALVVAAVRKARGLN
jgi:hypothetical protein